MRAARLPLTSRDSLPGKPLDSAWQGRTAEERAAFEALRRVGEKFRVVDLDGPLAYHELSRGSFAPW